MIRRSSGQKIGSQGHRWAMSKIEDHPDWLARDLSDDFGVDAEAELCIDGPNGEILKLQFKTSRKVVRKDGRVRFDIGRKYVEYARSCRIPVIFLRIDLSERRAWYLWLQRWILAEKAKGQALLDDGRGGFRTWVDESETLSRGLDSDLKDVAMWRGEPQLVLSLLDAVHAAAATYNSGIIMRTVALLSEVAPMVADSSLDVIVRECVLLGDRIRGTVEGLSVSDALFSLLRMFGDRISIATVDVMVRRGDLYSRTGLAGLAVLYDEYFEHVAALGLVSYFLDASMSHVAYYCALREANPRKRDVEFVDGPGGFLFAGLGFRCPADVSFPDKYANRGPSAILDYLVGVGDT